MVRTCELAEEGEAHADGTDFGGEDLGRVDVHCGVAKGSGGV